MTVTAKRLYGPAMISSASIAYTTPSATTTIIKQISVCNTSTSATGTFRLGVLGSGDSTLDAADCFMYDASISAKETIMINTSLVLNASEKLAVFSGTGGASISLMVNGIEET
jgi:hypothetical protein